MHRRARERAIAAEIAAELHRALGLIVPESLTENRDAVCEVFGRVFDRYQNLNEAAAARVLALVPKVLADMNLKFADLNRKLDAAVRQPLLPVTHDPIRRHI